MRAEAPYVQTPAQTALVARNVVMALMGRALRHGRLGMGAERFWYVLATATLADELEGLSVACAVPTVAGRT